MGVSRTKRRCLVGVAVPAEELAAELSLRRRLQARALPPRSRFRLDPGLGWTARASKFGEPVACLLSAVRPGLARNSHRGRAFVRTSVCLGSVLSAVASLNLKPLNPKPLNPKP